MYGSGGGGGAAATQGRALGRQCSGGRDKGARAPHLCGRRARLLGKLGVELLQRGEHLVSLELADDETSARHAGPFGSIGPVGATIPVYADIGLKGANDVVVGANKHGFHLKHVSLEAHAAVTAWVDIATVEAGDRCPKCAEALTIARGIEVGHVFKLGTKYTQAFESTFLDAEKQSRLMVMG